MKMPIKYNQLREQQNIISIQFQADDVSIFIYIFYKQLPAHESLKQFNTLI